MAVKRRKQIWEVLHPDLGGATCPTQPATLHKDRPQNQQQFAADTAAVSGQSKKDINRHLSRAEALGPDLQAVVGTSLDKGVLKASQAGGLASYALPANRVNSAFSR